MTWHDGLRRASWAVLLLLPAGLSGQASTWTGCYDVELGPWAPHRDFGRDSLYMAPPPRIRLQSDSAPPGLALTPAPGALPSVHRIAFWRHLGPDSVSFVWSNGFSGITMRLAASGEDLRGSARTFWDFPRETQTADVVARRVSCKAPLREEDRLAYHFPRGVELDGGDSIRVGEALPGNGVHLVEEKKNVYRVYGLPLAAPFSGAEQVRAVVDTAGVVRRIVVDFKRDVSHQNVLDAMIPLAGEPTTRSVHRQSDGSEMRHAIWSDRVMEVWLVSTGGDSKPLQLQIMDRHGRYGGY